MKTRTSFLIIIFAFVIGTGMTATQAAADSITFSIDRTVSPGGTGHTPNGTLDPISSLGTITLKDTTENFAIGGGHNAVEIIIKLNDPSWRIESFRLNYDKPIPTNGGNPDDFLLTPSVSNSTVLDTVPYTSNTAQALDGYAGKFDLSVAPNVVELSPLDNVLVLHKAGTTDGSKDYVDIFASDFVLKDWISSVDNAGTLFAGIRIDNYPSNGQDWRDNSGHNTVFAGASTAVPEPATMLLLGSGLVGLWGARRKFRK